MTVTKASRINGWCELRTIAEIKAFSLLAEKLFVESFFVKLREATKAREIVAMKAKKWDNNDDDNTTMMMMMLRMSLEVDEKFKAGAFVYILSAFWKSMALFKKTQRPEPHKCVIFSQ